MPTPVTRVRLGDELLSAARHALSLPSDAPVSQVIRAALQRLTSDPHATGEAEDKGGRPPKART
jgi:hypothetical protein